MKTSRGSIQPERADEDDDPRKREAARHHRERAHPAAALDEAGDRKLREHERARVAEEDEADPPLGDAVVVLREHRQELELRVAGRDEDDVQRHDRDERAIAQDVAVPACHDLVRRRRLGVGDEGQHGDHREVGRDVEEEEDGEARRIRGRCDQPAHEPAEADAGVDGDPLERERGVSFPVRRQPGEEHGRRRPEEAGTEAQHGRERERLPGPVDEREQPVADRRDGERGGDRRAMSRAVRRSTLRS
jgi:hypothetical protein